MENSRYNAACRCFEKKCEILIGEYPSAEKILVDLRAYLISVDDFQCRGTRRRYFGRLTRGVLKSAGKRQSGDDKLP